MNGIRPSRIQVTSEGVGMKELRNVWMGLALVAVLGLASLNVSTPDLGCGGTEFAEAPKGCPVADLDTTMDDGDLGRVQRKMCFRTLKADDECTVYDHNLVGVQ